MKIRDEELLARLRALGSKARRAPDGRTARIGADEAVHLLGLPEEELTPSVRAVLSHLIEEVVDLRDELSVTQTRLSEIERLADEDALAPISNRRAFLRQLDRTIGYIRRYNAEASLLYFDLNALKAINDDFGHAAGDQALIHVAETLLAQTRSSDLVGRLGGDEFGVILAQTSGQVAKLKARRLAEAVAARRLTFEDRVIPVSVAFGTCDLKPDQEPEGALALADQAMYAHKKAGR